ncbi:cytochrome c [Vibrio sp. SS-MA-C1-2]|uniref:c-type cytochrome n=1 Tax=Vibrio sp. SS-MA-C1-2 TaxID=2908646 RepID=UPI001F3CC1AA|nr:cytochrome c [Vibrio sp. SS-MA-C1-2]UJF17277.1 cytochrome c [Vibrio sp. SS-MA-C1-2]
MLTKILISFLLFFTSNVLAKDDIDIGKQLYLSPGKGGCINCHGENGNKPVMPMYPKIGGQSEMYLANQMRDYKLKKRKNGLFMTMEVAMAHYSDDDINQIAAYLSSVENTQ